MIDSLDVLDYVGGIISEGDDLDNYLDPGKYSSSTAGISGSLSNSPITAAGFTLYVIRVLNTRREQIAIDAYNNLIYYRGYTGSRWTDWSLITDLIDSLDILGELGTAINSGDDLDDYTAAGKYRASTSAVVSSLANCPTTAVFVLYVFNLGDTRYDAQILFANIASCDIFYRVLRGAGWTNWISITMS